MILLDTHVLVWVAEGLPRIGRRALRIVEQSSYGDALGVAAVSFWELSMLAEKGRVATAMSPRVLRHSMLARGIREVPLDGAIGIVAGELGGLRGDPADRMIVATALALDATLMTADESLLDWSGALRMVDARN